MGREESLVQDTHCDPGTILLPGTLDELCDRLFLGTHSCLELAYQKRFWRALKFLGGLRCGTLRPFPSRPSAPVSQLITDTSLSSASSGQHWYFLLFCPSASRHHVCLAPDACISPTHKNRRKMQLAGPLLSRLLATHCVRLLKETGCTDRTFVAIRTSFVLGMHESCFILGEKRGLGMVALPFYSPVPAISIRSSPPCWTLRRSRNRRPDRPSIPSRL